MIPTYKFLCVPLDSRNPEDSKNSFLMRIVTQIHFPPNTSHGPDVIRDALLRHPLLVNRAGSSLSGRVCPYKSWSDNGRKMKADAAVAVTINYCGSKDEKEVLNNLLNYMGAAKASVTPTSLKHDCSYDCLPDEHFVHVTKAADDFRELAHGLRHVAVGRFGDAHPLHQFSVSAQGTQGNVNEVHPASRLDSASVALANWIDSGMHAALVEAVTGGDETEIEQLYSAINRDVPTGSSIRAELDKLVRRMKRTPEQSCPLEEQGKLKGVGDAGQLKEVGLDDPNVAVHAALKHQLIAKECGFVTEWTVTCASPILGPIDYVIELDVNSLRVDKAKIDLEPIVPTAFRRGTHTHPTSYVDLGSANIKTCALVCLNDQNGVPRYRATSINADSTLVKQAVLPANNTLVSADSGTSSVNPKLAPAHLKNNRFGTPEPETSGIVFSAPTEDLIAPDGLRFYSDEKRFESFPCLFLEDLWAGFRLDLKRSNSTGYTSIHTLQQKIHFHQSAEMVSGETEDYIQREQPDDPALGYTSTDLFTYNGLSSGQSKDYQIFLGTDKAVAADSNQPFHIEMTGYGKSERLVFREILSYRFRTTFIGGISLECDDKELENPRFSKVYTQDCPFFRSRAMRPGEILLVQDEGPRENGKTIYLSSERSEVVAVLVPSPIDLDTSRFHGLVFSNEQELHTLVDRVHVTNLAQFLGGLPPEELNYFYDPDVYGVVMHTKVLNGDESVEPDDIVYSDGRLCLVRKHVTLPVVEESFGEIGKWRDFKPIILTFRTTRKTSTIRKGGWLRGCRHVEIEVPPATEVHISLLPLFDPALLANSASHISSSSQLFRSSSASQQKVFPFPTMAREVVKIIHCVESPRRPPTLVCTVPSSYPMAVSSEPICVAARELDSPFATFVGRVDLDAASTKEIRLEASWTDISDLASQDHFVLQPGNATANSRGVDFSQFEGVLPTASNFRKFMLGDGPGVPTQDLGFRMPGSSKDDFSAQFRLQCVEDKIFFNVAKPPSPPNDASSSNRINFKDQRRRLAKVRAVGVGRFTGKFQNSKGSPSVVSNELTVDVPSTMKLAAPSVSHIVPLKKDYRSEGERSRSRTSRFGLRIYLHKEWFQSGPGERLAIGCITGGGPEAKEFDEVRKDVTQWGEDPIERGMLNTTLRLPRASDFTVPDDEVTLDGDHFYDSLYPAHAEGGRARVIYRDNIPIQLSAGDTPGRWLSIASYVVFYDELQKLWYTDICMAQDFFGWCGLALYRHQPHALLLRELSEASAWAYASILYGEPVTWFEKDHRLHVTIGPVHDASIGFYLASVEFEDGVSTNIASGGPTPHELKKYKVGNDIYFEAVVPKKGFHWNLFKRRFEYSVNSMPLND